jgi:hypothetical protein
LWYLIVSVILPVLIGNKYLIFALVLLQEVSLGYLHKYIYT